MSLEGSTQHDMFRDRVAGCILGAAIGDAMGGPFEFENVALAIKQTGNAWIDRMHHYSRSMGPHHAYGDPPIRGLGTDDTRYNHILLQLAKDLGRLPTREEYAQRHLDIFFNPEDFFPRDVANTREQFSFFEPVASSVVGQPSVILPNRTARQRFERGVGMGFPMLLGLISLTSVGAFFPGRPEDAYAVAYDLAYYDTGYAREADGLLAAAISLGVVGASPMDVILPILEMDPLELGNCFEGPFVRERLKRLLDRVPPAMSDPQTAAWLARELRSYHPYDPYKSLAIAIIAMRTQPDNPLKALAIAINHVGEDDHFQDIDCYGSITGSLVGAMVGLDAFPRDLVNTVLEANRERYGFDLMKHVDDLCQIVQRERVA